MAEAQAAAAPTQVVTQTPTQRAMAVLESAPIEPAKEAVEAKVGEAAEAKVNSPADDIKSRRFAELSKKEQRILQKQQKLNADMKAREDALSAKEAQIKEDARKELRELVKKNPAKAFEELGTTYNGVTEAILAGGEPTAKSVEQDVKSEIAQLREELATTKKESLEREEQRKLDENKRILQTFNDNINQTVKNNPDKYPSVYEFGAAPVIYHMVEQRYQDTKGKHLMTIDEAAGLLEKDLRATVLRINARMGGSQPNKKENAQPKSLNKPTTITNELTSTAPSMLPAHKEEDRIRRALEKLV